MKKILLILFAVLFVSGCAVSTNDGFDILTLFSSESKSENKLWVGTFQLVFNDMKNKIIKKDIEFIGEKPTLDLKGLNGEEFNSSMLNPESYYTSWGKTSPLAKEEIKKGIKEKFNETSSIVDSLDWSEGYGKYYAYAMLKKQFEFLNEFDKLAPESFNNSSEKYDFFGIQDSSKDVLDKNIRVLFYNNNDDYAIQLLTKNNDAVYLYRTESPDSFEKIYNKMQLNSKNYKGSIKFLDIDTFKAPNLKFKSQRNYKELCNKVIKGTDFILTNAIETIELELDNKGGKVKSEAIIMADLTSVMPSKKPLPRHFDFNKTFVMFLVDSEKENPYLALRINNLDKFIK